MSMKMSKKTMMMMGGGLIAAVGVVGVGYYVYKMTRPKEVYLIGTGVAVPKEKAHALAASFGGVVAKKSQLLAAQKAGAEWCGAGWVTEEDGATINDAQYPMQDMPIDPATGHPVNGCGAANTVNTCNTCIMGVVAYGRKPSSSKVIEGHKAVPFNFKGAWNQPNNTNKSS